MSDSTHVRIDLHYTKNLGNYESLRIGISVEDFVRQGESVDAATERVYGFVENKLVEKVTQVTEELNNGKR
jgi:methyl coenzyme M reductase subunit D